MSSEWGRLSTSSFDTALADAQTYQPGINPSLNSYTLKNNFNLSDSVLFLAQMCQVAYQMPSYRSEYLTDGIEDDTDPSRDVVYEYMPNLSDIGHAVYRPLDTYSGNYIFAFKGPRIWGPAALGYTARHA